MITYALARLKLILREGWHCWNAVPLARKGEYEGSSSGGSRRVRQEDIPGAWTGCAVLALRHECELFRFVSDPFALVAGIGLDVHLHRIGSGDAGVWGFLQS